MKEVRSDKNGRRRRFVGRLQFSMHSDRVKYKSHKNPSAIYTSAMLPE